MDSTCHDCEITKEAICIILEWFLKERDDRLLLALLESLDGCQNVSWPSKASLPGGVGAPRRPAGLL